MIQFKTLKAIMYSFPLIALPSICFGQNPVPVAPIQKSTIKTEKKSIETASHIQFENVVLFDRSKLTREEQSFLVEKDVIMCSDMDKQEKEGKIAALKEKMLCKKSH